MTGNEGLRMIRRRRVRKMSLYKWSPEGRATALAEASLRHRQAGQDLLVEGGILHEGDVPRVRW